MQPLIFIQFGDRKACINNSVTGWEYTIGRRLEVQGLDKTYSCYNLGKGLQRFYCHPRDATNFKLEIIF